MEQNVKKKISCGGFMLGEGLVLSEDGKTLSVSGGGGGGAQSDWNQNDSTAADYVKNRPFYTGDPVENVLVEESTVPFTSSGAGLYYATIQSAFKLTTRETYKVSWDETVYECTCADFSGSTIIGNLSIMGAGSDTGEPFLITPLADNSGIEIYTKDTSASHTISISESIVEVTQIPDKYISDTFRDVVIAGNPLEWSEDDWTKYYNLFKNGKLLKINRIGKSQSEGYVLSMVYNASQRIYDMSGIDFTGNLYSLGVYKDGGEDKFYWAPIINLGAFYFSYQQSGSDTSKEYNRLEGSGVLEFVTKKANEDEVRRNVVLEGDKELILSSSTSGSTKKFKITVDDSGTLKATEI